MEYIFISDDSVAGIIVINFTTGVIVLACGLGLSLEIIKYTQTQRNDVSWLHLFSFGKIFSVLSGFV